jgi:hypothetical protein
MFIDNVIKVKIWVDKSFSDFVVKPEGFESHRSLLFKKVLSNLSFIVGGEVVYVLHGPLTSKCDYFRAMLEGSFKEAQVPMNVESEIDVEELKMIISNDLLEGHPNIKRDISLKI